MGCGAAGDVGKMQALGEATCAKARFAGRSAREGPVSATGRPASQVAADPSRKGIRMHTHVAIDRSARARGFAARSRAAARAVAAILLSAPLLAALPAAASETLLQRHTTNLSVTRAGSLHVNDDSLVALGAPKFVVWGNSDNPSQTQPELSLFTLGSSGNVIGVRNFVNFGGQSCKASRIVRTQDKGYAMLGHCTLPPYSTADISSVLFKVDASFNPMWSISIDQSPEVATYFMANDLKELAGGDLAIVATISSPVSLQFHNYNIAVVRLKSDGSLIWSNRYEILDTRAEGLAIHESLAKDLYVAGSIQPVGGTRQSMVMKLDAAGVRQWSYGYGINATSDGAAWGIAQKSSTTATEEFHVAGWLDAAGLTNARDVHVMSIDANGTLLSSHIHGSAGNEEARWLTVLPKTSGNLDSLFFTGVANGIGAGGDDAFLLETLGSATIQDFTTHGGTGNDGGREVDVLAGRVYAVGDLLQPMAAGSSARKGLLVVDDVGPPPTRVRCGTAQKLGSAVAAVPVNVAKFKTFALPLRIAAVPSLSTTTGSTVARCGALPN
jgi:hypothetical protein